MDFVTRLSISTNWKNDNYDSILVIIDWLTKIIHYKPVKVTINALRLAKVILDVVVWHYGLPDSIMTNKSLFFTLKFWLSLCYFFGIKQRLSTAFYPQKDGQTKRQNSIIKAYFKVFVNFKPNDQARLLLKAEFTYNNTKNASTGYIPFELNCGYHPCISYEKDINLHSKSKLADDFAGKLREVMAVCQKNL